MQRSDTSCPVTAEMRFSRLAAPRWRTNGRRDRIRKAHNRCGKVIFSHDGVASSSSAIMAAEDYDPEFPTGDENGEWSPSRAAAASEGEKVPERKVADETRTLQPATKEEKSISGSSPKLGSSAPNTITSEMPANLSQSSLVTEDGGKWQKSSTESEVTKSANTQPKLGFKGFKWIATASTVCQPVVQPLPVTPSPPVPDPKESACKKMESPVPVKAASVDDLASPAIKELLAPVVKYEAPSLMAETEFDDDDLDFDLPFPPDMDDAMYDLQLCAAEPPPPPPPPLPPPLPIPPSSLLYHHPIIPPTLPSVISPVIPCMLPPLITQIPPPLLLPPPPPPPLPPSTAEPSKSTEKKDVVEKNTKAVSEERSSAVDKLNIEALTVSVVGQDVPLPPDKCPPEPPPSPAVPREGKATPSKPTFIGRDAFLSQLKKDSDDAKGTAEGLTDSFNFTPLKKPTIKFGAFKSLLENLGDAVVPTDNDSSSTSMEVSNIALPLSSPPRAPHKGPLLPSPHEHHSTHTHHQPHSSHSQHRSHTSHSHHSPHRHHHHHHQHNRPKSWSQSRNETYGIEVVGSHSHHGPSRADAAHSKSTHRPSRFSPAYTHSGTPRTLFPVGPMPQDGPVIAAPPSRTLVQVYPPPCADPSITEGSSRAVRPLLPRPLQALPNRTPSHVVRPHLWTKPPEFVPPFDVRQPPPGYPHVATESVQVQELVHVPLVSVPLDERTQVSNLHEDPDLKTVLPSTVSANLDPRLKSPVRGELKVVAKPEGEERWQEEMQARMDTSLDKAEEQMQRPPSPMEGTVSTEAVGGESSQGPVLTRESSNSNGSSGEAETEETSVETSATPVVPAVPKKGRRKKGQKDAQENGMINSDGTALTRRRSSRIKSLEERKEKERAEKEKEKVAVGGGPGAGPSLANRSLPCENGDDSNSTLSGTETSVRQCASSRQSPRVGNCSPGASQNSDDGVSPKPEKVKSRWRRNSELERAEKSTDVTNTNSDAARALTFLSMPKSSRPALLPTPALYLNGEVCPDAGGSPQWSCPSATAAQVPVEEKMPRFDIIPENVYLTERRKSKINKEVRRMVCDCTISKDEVARGFVACGEDCLNRLLMIECGSRCPTGDLCSNKRFQKREFSKAEAFKTAKKGWGLRALEDLPEGSFIMEYVGEVLDPREFRKRVKEYARDNNQHHYFMALRADEIIDATQKGNLSRFINHSCCPNSETQKWTVNGDLRIGFFTRQFVGAGEEITFDYQFQRYGKEAQRCYCESDCCRGFIGGENQAPIKMDVNLKDVNLKDVNLKDVNLKKEVVVVPRKKKQIVEERRKEFLDDKDLEEEIEKLCAFGGLRNRNHTLTLARLMVRAVNVDSRMTLLNLMQKTTEQACLRLFLDYHGLSLMWSWMVDISNTEEMIPLKIEILKTLQVLPISNKTMVLDNKLMSVVQRWSAQIAEQAKPLSNEDGMVPSNTPVEEPDSEPCTRVPSPQSVAPADAVTDEIGTESNLVEAETETVTDEAKTVDENVEDVADQEMTESDEVTAAVETEVVKPTADVLEEDLSKSGTNDDVDACSEMESEKLTSGEVEVQHNDVQINEGIDDKNDRDADVTMEVPASADGISESEEAMVVDNDSKTGDNDGNGDGKLTEENTEVEMKDEDCEESEPKSQDADLSDGSLPFKEPLVPLPETCPTETPVGADAECAESAGNKTTAPEKDSSGLIVKNELEEKVTMLANSLIETWSSLKEAFRIPKREQNESRREHEREADRRESEGDRRGKDLSWDRSRDRYSDRFDRDTDKYKNDRKRPWDSPDQTKDKDRKIKNDKKFPKIEEIVDNEKPKKYLLPTPTRMSKEERRQLFELKVQQEEADALRRQIEEATVIRRQQEEEEYFRRQQHEAMMAAIAADPNAPPGATIYYETPFAGYFDPNAGGFMPAVSGPPLNVMPPVNHVIPSGMMTPVANNPGAVMNPVVDNGAGMMNPVANHAAGMMNQVANAVTIVQVNSVAPQTSSIPMPIAEMSVAAEDQHTFTPPQTPVVFSAPNAYQASQVHTVPHTVPSIGGGPDTTPVPNFPQNANHFAAPSPAQTVYYSTPQGVVLHLPENATWPGPLVQIVDDVPPPPVLPKAPKVAKLPPSWKSAKDAEGRVYYYHAVTRQTQWEPPGWDQPEESGEGDLGTPTADEPKVTTTAAADTSSELARRTKELFRTKMSQFMVQCLNPYRKPDCQLGRITCTDDFKHLARKLTHFVMAKELKYCRNVEDLECNDNVKHKTKDFVKKYMIKFGPVYKKAATSPHYE